MRFPITFILCLLTSAALAADAPDPGAAQLERGFHETVHPFVKSYCFQCHSGAKPKGDFDLSSYSTAEAAAKDYRRWELMAERLDAKEMPPDEAKRHPAAAESRLVIDWIQSVRRYEAKKNAGDPGPVFARRLSNAEYDYTIRDLIGVDLRPAQHFPIDPANQAGFDNSSESLTMTPSLVKKYLEAARLVSDHLVFTTDGFEFAPHPVVADTDCDKYCVNRIIHFYQRQCTDYAKYFEAAWRYKNREALGRPWTTLNDIATEAGVSPKYLATIWSTLTGSTEDIGPTRHLQAMWRELPAGGQNQAAVANRGCEKDARFRVEPAGSACPACRQSRSCRHQQRLAARGVVERSATRRQPDEILRRCAQARARVATEGFAGSAGDGNSNRPGCRRPIRGNVRTILRNIPRCFRRLRTCADLSRSQNAKRDDRPLAQRRLSQSDGLFPRRWSALQAPAQ